MTKVLLRHEGSSYVIDLDKLKTKTVREIVTEVGDDKLLVLTTAQAEPWDLDSLLDRALAPKEPPPGDQPGTVPTRATRPELKYGTEAREWAKANGIEVKDRGTVTTEVFIKFFDAHPDKKPEGWDERHPKK